MVTSSVSQQKPRCRRHLKETLQSIQPPKEAWGRGYSDLKSGTNPYVKGFFLADLTADEAMSYYVQEFRRHDFALKEDNKQDSPRLLRFCGNVYQADITMTQPEHPSQPLRYEVILRLKDARCD
jgi:hypothetical protein